MRDWWTPSEIAEARLPDLPESKRRINGLIEREGWQARDGRARRRKGRGGGWEYHRSLFPQRAQAAILRVDTRERAAPAAPVDRDAAWAAYDRLPRAAKLKAEARLKAIQSVEALIAGGEGKDSAARLVARIEGVSARSIWNWLELVSGAPAEDRLAHLAPRHRMARRDTAHAPINAEAWAYFKTDYLRQGEVAFASCYRRLEALSNQHGWAVPSERALRRRLKREVPRAVQILKRKGPRAAAALYPAQVRDKSAMHAMHTLNADYHRWDVFVRWGDEIVRPQMVAFQDIYSGRILSWRFAQTANTSAVQLAFGDVVERWGIPLHIVLDNGREFASKWFTGGVETRFRGKVREDDIIGTLPAMGITVHWATPYSGQSKPIERAFRDLCGDIARDVRFDGAYTGNSPDAKPENYGATAVEFEVFRAVVEQGIAAHNARTGRRSAICAGRSFDEAFSQSYETAPIAKATPEQRRFWMLGTERVRADRRTGQVRLLGNVYWSPWMTEIAGQDVLARFDPDALHDGVHLYDTENSYLAEAGCHEAQGFLSVDAARTHSRARRAYGKALRHAAEAEVTMSKSAAGTLLDGLAPKPAPAPEATVIRPMFAGRKGAPAPGPRDLTLEEEAAHEATIAQFTRPLPEAESDPALERYREAVALEHRIAAGEDIDPASRDWLRIYQEEPEYRGFALMRETFGDALLG